MESSKTNEAELTSTMGNLMSTSKSDKTDASDSTPTSSTDAFTATSSSHIAADDPISSTSSDVSDSKKSAGEVAQSSTNVVNACPSKSFSRGDHSSLIVSEKDLLDMNITDTSVEKITENVDDIVQDLENLLGEPTASFNFTVRTRHRRNSRTSQDKDIAMDLDAFSAELQMLTDQSSGTKDIPKPVINQSVEKPQKFVIKQSTDIEGGVLEPIKNHIKEDVKAEKSISTDARANITDTKENAVLSEPVPLTEDNPPKQTGQEIESSRLDSKDTAIEKDDNRENKDFQSEIISVGSGIEKSKSEENIPLVRPETDDAAPTHPEIESIPSEHPETEGIPAERPEMRGIQSAPPKTVDAASAGPESENIPSKYPEPKGIASAHPETEYIASKHPKTEDISSEQDGTASAHPEVDGIASEDPETEGIRSEPPEMEDIALKRPEIDITPAAHPATEGITLGGWEREDKPAKYPETGGVPSVHLEEEDKPLERPEMQGIASAQPETEHIPSEDPKIEAIASKHPETECISLSHPDTRDIPSAHPDPEGIASANLETDVMPTHPEIESIALAHPKTEAIPSTQSKTEALEESQSNFVAQEPKDVEEKLPNLSSSENVEEKADPEVLLTFGEDQQTERTADKSTDLIPGVQIDEVDDKEVAQQSKDTVEEKNQDIVNVKEGILIAKEGCDVSEDVNSLSIVVPEDVKQTEEIQSFEKIAENLIVDNLKTKSDELESLKLPESHKPESPRPTESSTEIQEESDASVVPVEKETSDILEPEEICNTVEGQSQHPDGVTKQDSTQLEVAAALMNEAEEPIEVPVSTLQENRLVVDIDNSVMVQNAIHESISAAVSSIQEKLEETNTNIPSSTSVDNLRELAMVENNLLPLEVDVPDLEVLNAISSLSDNQASDMPQNITESDALLSSSTLEEPLTGGISFETTMDTALPTVEEIFAEQNQEIDVQDENLETLLAVASLQNVDYNIPPVEDFRSSVEEMSSFVPEDSLLPQEVAPAIEKVEMLEQEAPVEKEKLDKKVVSEDVTPKNIVENEIIKVAQEQENNLKEPLMINVEDNDKERVYSPKITIKPIKPPEEEEEEAAVISGSGDTECSKGSLKMTITKQSDNTHSILKIYDPDHDNAHEESIPKLIIKPVVQPNEQPQSPKMSTRSSKQVFSPSSSTNQRSASPRITIKPIPKPDEPVAPLKITIKPVLKSDDSHKQKHSPKLTIKTILKPEEESNLEPKMHSPRVTIKPIIKPPEEIEQVPSPRITIKPIVKPAEVQEQVQSTPRLTIKPVVKPEKEIVETVERSSPKITIKPIVKPQDTETSTVEDFEESIKERIVLKINKATIPGSSKESRKRDLPPEEEKSEKLPKMKLKFSKGGGHPQIVQDQSPPSSKRASDQFDHDKNKRQRTTEPEHFLPSVTITPIGPGGGHHSKLKEMLSRGNDSSNDGGRVVTIDDDDDVTLVEERSKASPIVISEESNQDSLASSNAIDLRDPISEIPVFEITPDSVKTLNPQPVAPPVEAPAVVAPPAPRKRGRPRKVPLQVREDFKDPKEEEPKPVVVVVESTRPKRSCRGQSVRTTLGIKPRKPRGPGRGRGSKRGMGTRSTGTPPETPTKAAKEPKLGGTKLKELREESFLLSDKSLDVKTLDIDDGLQKSPSNSLLAPPQSDTSTDRADIVMYEEETRMSAETSSSSRAQTPAKQVVTTIPTVDLVEESQSSVQSSATTESVKVRRGPRLEVHQEPEGAVISADQLAEYFWSGGGPFMLQEQVAQFLGIKSFKRKYPNIARRVVDMQERDFIRESGLAGEAMCDLGLTAVNSSDILDIMYSDFQDKYEEYCKHQRDRQAKDLINKQKALSLAASQEKAKMDITQQAVQSAASWNATFNKARRDQRKSCMDLQTLTIHFPKGKMKQIGKPKIGYYPVALVPGQYTDYYREFTPTEINNLPLTTLCYEPVIRSSQQEMDCDSQTDGSGSESDSSSSDTDSSYSGSSDGEDCTLCKATPKRVAAAQ